MKSPSESDSSDEASSEENQVVEGSRVRLFVALNPGSGLSQLKEGTVGKVIKLVEDNEDEDDRVWEVEFEGCANVLEVEENVFEVMSEKSVTSESESVESIESGVQEYVTGKYDRYLGSERTFEQDSRNLQTSDSGAEESDPLSMDT